MKNPSIHKSPKGFTLVELLVVIAIIAVLAALAFPAVTGVIRKANITKSKKVATDLTFAINSFQDDYDYLPYTGSSAPSDDLTYVTSSGDFLDVLMGEDETINPNKKKFFSSDAAKNNLNGLIYNGDDVASLVDAFGHPYEILIDFNYDDKLEPSEINAKFTDDETVRSTSAIIATPGANEDGWSTADSVWKDNYTVKSW